VKILSIKAAPPELTVDIEVAETHSYQLSNGCVSHNTTSKLFGLTEGWHLPAMAQYLRWVQFRNDDPLVKTYRNAGYPTRDLKTYSGTTIVGFPTQPAIGQLGMGDALVTASEATPEEQYHWLALGERFWIIGTDERGSPLHAPGKDYGNQISYCLAGGKHLVTTGRGLERIESIGRGYTQDRNGSSQQIVALVDNGVKDTLRVRLENGAAIIGTQDHKILCVDRDLTFTWKRLSEIEVGDIAVRRLGNPQHPTVEVGLPALVMQRTDGRNGNMNHCTAPMTASVEFALFLGMLMSDGHLSTNGFGLTTASDEAAALFTRLLKDLFGTEPTVKFDSRGKNLRNLTVNCRSLMRWLADLGVAKNHSENAAPDCILQSPTDVQRAFIKGYTLDGYVAVKSGWVYSCTTTSETMARDIAGILWGLGLDAQIHWKAGRVYKFADDNMGIGLDQWQVSLGCQDSVRLVSEIGFVETHKGTTALASNAGKVERHHKRNSVWAAPFQDFYRANKAAFTGNRETLRSAMKMLSGRLSMGLVRREFGDQEFCSHLLDPNLRFTRVVEKASDGEHHTYDITVDVSHEYVANGVVVHNTLKYDPAVVGYAEFRDMLIKHQALIRCCSVLPVADTSAYEYVPEQALSKVEYEKLARAVVDAAPSEQVDFAHVDCGGGACPVDFKEREELEVIEADHGVVLNEAEEGRQEFHVYGYWDGSCRWCDAAVELLRARGNGVVFFDVKEDTRKRVFFAANPGVPRTVPQIWQGGREAGVYIGGYSDLVRALGVMPE